MTSDEPGRQRIRAAQHRRWASMTPSQRAAQMAKARLAADTRWERKADPAGLMSSEERAVAGARLRDEHYRELLGEPA